MRTLSHTAQSLRPIRLTDRDIGKADEMAPLSRLLVAVALLHAAAAAAASDVHGDHRYDRVFSFGDSLTDTGNARHLSPTGGGPASRPPYGETFFRRPTGRASDGRLVVDFIGEQSRAAPAGHHTNLVICMR